jgi:hypothetical protein
MFEGRPCLFCLNESASRLGLDKRGRPFLHCCACGARAFLPSFSPCLNGLAILTPLARAVAAEMASSQESWTRHRDTIADFLSGLRSQTVGGPAKAAQPSPNQLVHVPLARPA